MQSAYPTEYNREDFEKRLADNLKNHNLLTEHPAQVEPEDAPAASLRYAPLGRRLLNRYVINVAFPQVDEICVYMTTVYALPGIASSDGFNNG